MKEIALLGKHVADIAGPDRYRQHHDVHRRERGDAETTQQRSGAFRFLGLRPCPLKRIGLVAQLGETVDERCRIDRSGLPLQRQTMVGQVDPRQLYGGHGRKTALDL